jgi:isopentenyldiphosphate isomerase
MQKVYYTLEETDERLETFEADGSAAGIVLRSRVHREGLWHRVANVFLFRSDGRLILQRRHGEKDVCPGLWDLSIAEHLKPGETYSQGAARGLREELGIDGIDLERLGAVTPVTLEISEQKIKDYELQQSFRGFFDGDLRPNAAEVCEIDTIALRDLAAAFERRPGEFTPWFRRTAMSLGLCR